MANFSYADITEAMDCMLAMDEETLTATKRRLILSQPSMFASTLAIQEAGASDDDMDNMLGLLLMVLMAMERSGLPWPKIGIKVVERGFFRLLGTVQLAEGISLEAAREFRNQWMDQHDEPFLMKSIYAALIEKGYSGAPENALSFDLTALNFAETLAIVGKTLPLHS